MKTLYLHLTAELQVPDNWELVDHASGMTVLKLGNHYVDFDLAPLTTRSNDPEAEWSDATQDVVAQVLDCVTGLDVDLTEQTVQ